MNLMPSSPDPTLCCPPLLEAPLDEAHAAELATVLKALADPARLRLISIVAAAPGGEACACDLALPLGRSQPTVSHHLSQLVKAGLLEREQRGKWAWFKVRRERIDALCAALGYTDSVSVAISGQHGVDALVAPLAGRA